MRGSLIYWSYRLLGALVGPLPPALGYQLARFAGWLLYSFSPRLRGTLTHNVRHVLGSEANEADVRSYARQACVNIAKGHYDLFRVSRSTAEEILKMTRLEGWDLILKALTSGRGVILASAHMGGLEVALHVPAILGFRLLAPAMHTQPERLFQYACKLRQSHGVQLIPSDGPMFALWRALRRGELILLGSDRDVTGNGRLVQFFGTPTHLPEGPVRLALRSGAALVPVFSLRRPDDTILIRVEPPLELEQTGNPDADTIDGMEKLVAVMETYIAEYPGQWLVAAPIWPLD